MIKYLAITQSFAEWLYPKSGLIATTFDALTSFNLSSNPLASTDFAQDAIRISCDSKLGVCAVWHADYLTGTGTDNWGVIKWEGEMSLPAEQPIGHEVFERCLYVINQRLQGLLLDGSLFYRTYDNETHTLLAGRGAIAHQLSIGYGERVVGSDGLQSRSLIIVGPERVFSKLSDAAFHEMQNLPNLCDIANSLINATRRKELAASDVLPGLRSSIRPYFELAPASQLFGSLEVREQAEAVNQNTRYLSLAFDDWLHPDSPLSEAKRRILASDTLEQHPLRVLGPAGSGKTLLMQLLALSKLRQRSARGQACSILYIAHSRAMEQKVRDRFLLLAGPDNDYSDSRGRLALKVTTLADYAREQLGVDANSVIDTDADAAKQFQLDQILDALQQVRLRFPNSVIKSAVFGQIFANERLLSFFAVIVLVEISIAIKGQGLETDRRRYVESEKSLSLLHGNLDRAEREFIYEVFLAYHDVVFNQHAVLDPDDIAISLAGRLRVPVWQLRRKTEGFDYIFVDEAQLFNENERRLFPLLAKSEIPAVPIALALDQAQATYGQSAAGLSTIGIKDITNERLMAVHRSTEAIIKLAFFFIQRSTELFGPDFPDFTRADEQLVPSHHALASLPSIEKQGVDSPTMGKFVLKRVRELRRANLRQIAVLCYADLFWNDLEGSLSQADLPFQVIKERGAKFPQEKPLVSLVKPSLVGGQEFDAVIIVGLESGVMPPNIRDNQAFATAIEQQMIRDIYLGITRARYQVMFAISKVGMPNTLLQQACQAQLLK